MLKVMFDGNKTSFNITQHCSTWWPNECNTLDLIMLDDVSGPRSPTGIRKLRVDSGTMMVQRFNSVVYVKVLNEPMEFVMNVSTRKEM